jgi:hypothetical protein
MERLVKSHELLLENQLGLSKGFDQDVRILSWHFDALTDPESVGPSHHSGNPDSFDG